MGFGFSGHGTVAYAAAKFSNGLNCSSGNGAVHNSGGPFTWTSSHSFTLDFWIKTAVSYTPNQNKVLCGWGSDGYAYITPAGLVGIYLPPNDATGHACTTACND